MHDKSLILMSLASVVLAVAGCSSTGPSGMQTASADASHPYPESQSDFTNPNPEIERLHVQAYHLDIGHGVPRDQVRANELYLKAAMAGDARSMFNLSVNLMHGDGIVKDEVESFAWVDLARFMTQASSDRNTKWHIRAFHEHATKTLTSEQIKRGRQRAKQLEAMITPGQLK